ncbi:hypothetical protein MSAN_02495100 [Mycena sanguinolenta]|uniref:Uncharacterized protein n=1 Tax=Mycena sanguinolenta TaxID=230812 RepID=A0A8H6TZ84_9AGAR|nr:hypothetical protein MSAN_02495100 [Mycena sanguinolenta]
MTHGYDKPTSPEGSITSSARTTTAARAPLPPPAHAPPAPSSACAVPSHTASKIRGVRVLSRGEVMLRSGIHRFGARRPGGWRESVVRWDPYSVRSEGRLGASRSTTAHDRVPSPRAPRALPPVSRPPPFLLLRERTSIITSWNTAKSIAGSAATTPAIGGTSTGTVLSFSSPSSVPRPSIPAPRPLAFVFHRNTYARAHIDPRSRLRPAWGGFALVVGWGGFRSGEQAGGGRTQARGAVMKSFMQIAGFLFVAGKARAGEGREGNGTLHARHRQAEWMKRLLRRISDPPEQAGPTAAVAFALLPLRLPAPSFPARRRARASPLRCRCQHVHAL